MRPRGRPVPAPTGQWRRRYGSVLAATVDDRHGKGPRHGRPVAGGRAAVVDRAAGRTRGSIGGSRPGQPTDDPALGGRVRRRQPGLRGPRCCGPVAIRPDRGTSADAPDLDHADAHARRDRRTGGFAGGARGRHGPVRPRPGRLCGHAGHQFRVRDRPLPPPRRGGVLHHGVRLDLGGEADPDGSGPVRHLGDHLHGGDRTRWSGARPSGS